VTNHRPRAALLSGLAIVSLIASACAGTAATAAPSGGAVSAAPPASQAPATAAASEAAPSAGDKLGGTLVVWTAWGGGELSAFQAVLAPFIEKTGIDVRLTTVRDVSQLEIGVDAGTSLPDIAFPPSIGNRQKYADNGVMKPLEDFLDMAAYTSETVPALASSDVYNGKHYLEYVKTQVKGLLWYNPKVYTGAAPKTWDELMAIQPPAGVKLFCNGFESGDASGWPASDDMANIVMRSAGEQVYVDWYNGKVKWTDPAIKKAYQLFGQKVSDANTYGGATNALTTAFQRSGKALFGDKPGCLFLEQATFMTSFFLEDYPNLVAGEDYAFFPHPAIDPNYAGNIEGFADSFVMYNDTPQSRALMQYLATADAQSLWVKQGGTLAANTKVTDYPDPIMKSASEIVNGAKNVLLTAGDQMPSEMQHAFWRSLLDFTADQSKLDEILSNLDTVQSSAYSQ
jgi:alpha-glucoside transport system substrate-binding protein